MNCLFQHTHLLIVLLSLVIITSCEQASESPVAEDKLLAEVFNKQLYLSELEGIIQPGMTKADSSQLINTYVEKWVRDNLLLHEAEKNIPLDLNIDELVKNYRASLVRHNFEKILVELQLDSTVSQQTLTEYYEKNPGQYRLKNSIARCYFIKVPLTAPDLDALDRFWKKDTEESYLTMLDYANDYAHLFMLEDSSWYEIDRLLLHLPKDELKNSDVKKGKTLLKSDDEYRYYLRVFERVSAGNMAPIGHVEDRITQLILHQRKIKLLEDKKEMLYEQELGSNNIKIYTN